MLTQAALLVAIATSAYASPLVVRQEPLKDCGGIAYPPSKYNCFEVDASGMPTGNVPVAPQPCGAANGGSPTPPTMGLGDPAAGGQNLPPPSPNSAFGPNPYEMAPTAEMGGNDAPFNPPRGSGQPGFASFQPLGRAPSGSFAPTGSAPVKRQANIFKLAPIIAGTPYFPCGADFYSDAEYCCEAGRLLQRSTGTPPPEPAADKIPVPIGDAGSPPPPPLSLYGEPDAPSGPSMARGDSKLPSGPFMAGGDSELPVGGPNSFEPVGYPEPPPVNGKPTFPTTTGPIGQPGLSPDGEVPFPMPEGEYPAGVVPGTAMPSDLPSVPYPGAEIDPYGSGRVPGTAAPSGLPDMGSLYGTEGSTGNEPMPLGSEGAPLEPSPLSNTDPSKAPSGTPLGEGATSQAYDPTVMDIPGQAGKPTGDAPAGFPGASDPSGSSSAQELTSAPPKEDEGEAPPA